jgi:hypothetical protein
MAHYDEDQRAPQPDGSGSASINEIIGHRDDAVTTTTLAGRVHALEEHQHSAGKIYPNLADSIQLTAEAADWGLGGALVEIIPAAGIGQDFDIHFIYLSAVSAVREYQVLLYYGAGDTFLCSKAFRRTAGIEPVLDRRVQTVIIPAGSRVRARLASAGGVADTAEIKLEYHEYD